MSSREIVVRQLDRCSPATRAVIAGSLMAVTGALFISYDTPPENMMKTVAGQFCDWTEQKCFYEPEPLPLAASLEGGEFDIDTIVLRGGKAVEARYGSKSEVPVIGTDIDVASSSSRGTVGFEASVEGLVSATPRSNGRAVAITTPGGHFIDISGFYFRSQEPRTAYRDACPPVLDHQLDTGCLDNRISTGKWEGIPFLSADPNRTVATEMGKVSDIYEIEQRCIYDQMIIPMMIRAAAEYKLTLTFPSNENRFTEVARLLVVGSLRHQFQQMGPAQKLLVPVSGEVAPPADIVTLFSVIESETNGEITAPHNLEPDYCADKAAIGDAAYEQLYSDVKVLLMYALAPKYFNTQTMQYENGNEALTEPTDEEKEALGVPTGE